MDRFIQTILAEHRENWPELFDPELIPFSLALHRGHGLLYGRACAVMGQFGLSPAEFDVLASLRRSPAPHELTPSQLQQALVITSGGLTKILHQLEQRGFITRLTVHGDRRIKPVRLTGPAFSLIEQALAEVLRQTGERVRSALTPEEIRVMTGLLLRLAEQAP
ncbi:MAG: MarR family transcriptional regulator [Magnetococcales bacterium]|nr:MarR family transcriptional regulator [Magnetococcales bacterium]